MASFSSGVDKRSVWEPRRGPQQRRRPLLVRAVLTTLAEQQDGSLPAREPIDGIAERLHLGPEVCGQAGHEVTDGAILRGQQQLADRRSEAIRA